MSITPQNTKSNCSKDYSLQTANTGIGTVSAANNALNGTGNTVKVYTAGGQGSTIKSVTIKATEPVTTGMIRIFIKKTNTTVLYKEVPISISPELSATPTPTPILPMFEMVLEGEMKLAAGDEIFVSTQTANKFNIFVEGLDWVYPTEIPSECCNFKQVTAETGLTVVDLGNTQLNGTGAINAAYSTSSLTNGSYIKNVTIKALQSTSINSAIRIFLSNDNGSTFFLMKEIMVPQTVQSAYEPSFKDVINLDYYLAPNHIIGISTQNSEAFGITVEAESWIYPI